MMTILLHLNHSKPLYRQIADAIQKQISDGELKPNEKLPSRRALASHLQVGISTVQTAYEQLIAEGYLYTRSRSGFFVDPDAYMFSIQMKNCNPCPTEKIEATSSDKQIIFSTRGVDLTQFPFSTWAKLSRQVLSSKREALLQSIPSMGLSALQEAIASHLCAFRGIQVSPAQILVGAGTEYLLGILVHLLGASKRFGVEEPGYPKGKQVLRSNGTSVIGIPMDTDGIQIDELEKNGISVALITPSHQFPTGKVMPIRRRVALLQWASEQSGRYLIEDDFDSELRFHGKPLPSIYSMDVNAHTIYMNTFARTLAPSLRIGYLVLPKQLMKKYQNSLSFYSSTVPSFEQYTLVQFLNEGHLEHHLNRIKKRYQQRQILLKTILKSHKLSPFVQIYGDSAGLHMLLEIHLQCKEQELLDAAKQEQIIVSGLSSYYDNLSTANALPYPCVVLGYASLSLEQITKGFKRLLDAWIKFLP